MSWRDLSDLVMIFVGFSNLVEFAARFSTSRRDCRDLAVKFDSFCILPRFWKTQTSYRDCQNITQSFPDHRQMEWIIFRLEFNCFVVNWSLAFYFSVREGEKNFTNTTTVLRGGSEKKSPSWILPMFTEFTHALILMNYFVTAPTIPIAHCRNVRALGRVSYID